MRQAIDYLIIGQGLAGTLLADRLLGRNKRIIVYDEGHRGNSTVNAAGIINPVTGRRFVKSWMFEDLIPVALEQYRSLERQLGISLIRERNIVRSLPDHRILNDWIVKSTWPDYQPYVVAHPDVTSFQHFLNMDGLWCEVKGSYQIDLPLLITAMRSRLSSMRLLREEHFDQGQLRAVDKRWQYQDLKVKNVIFCEGFRLGSNPFFKSPVFLNPSKGEHLLLSISGCSLSKMIKWKYFLVPLEKDLFWFGAKDGWHFSDSRPSGEAFELLHRHADKMVQVPYEILEHRAAIRPTIKDRRPVIGKHDSLDGIYLFNGLGTKGSSLGPYWAEQLIRYTEEKVPLSSEVDVSRFTNQS